MAKVCLVGPCAPYRGGIAHYMALLAKAMARQSDVQVFNFTRMYPELLFPGRTQYDHSETPLDFTSLRILDSISPLSWLKTASAVAKEQPDLVVYQWWHPFFAPAFRTVSLGIRRLAPRAKQVFVCHNANPHERSFIDGALTKIAFAGCDGFLAHSETERKLVEEIAGGKTVLVHQHPRYEAFVPGQVDREQARRELGVSGDVLLFFGYIRAYKGLRDLIEAMPDILATRPVTLIVAGEFYENRQEYESLIERLGLSDNVVLHDRYIANEDVAQYFSAADLVVQPYVTATQSGISQLAFAFGKPVLATEVGGIPEAIDHGRTGLLVPPSDPPALAAETLRFFAENLGPVMSETILEESSTASWDSLADTLLSLA